MKAHVYRHVRQGERLRRASILKRDRLKPHQGKLAEGLDRSFSLPLVSPTSWGFKNLAARFLSVSQGFNPQKGGGGPEPTGPLLQGGVRRGV